MYNDRKYDLEQSYKKVKEELRERLDRWKTPYAFRSLSFLVVLIFRETLPINTLNSLELFPVPEIKILVYLSHIDDRGLPLPSVRLFLQLSKAC